MPLSGKIIRFFGSLLLIGIVPFIVASCGPSDKNKPAPPAIPIGRVETRIPAENSALSLGRGYDSLAAEPRDACIIDPERNLLPPAPGAGSTGLQVQDIKNTSQLATALNMSAAATFGFGEFSGSASYQYTSTKDVSRYAEQLLISVSVENERQLIQSDYKLTAPALKALKRSKQDFVNLCGDQFIAGKVTGGDFKVVFNAEASTETEQTDMAGAFNAAYLANNVNVTAAQKFKSYQENGKLSVSVLRKGPNEDIPPLTVPDLITYARTYPTKVDSHGGKPWTIAYVLLPYREVLDTSDLSPQQAMFMDSNSSYLRQLFARRSGLIFISSHKDQFAPYDQDHLNAETASLESAIGGVRAAALACARDKTHCNQVQQIQIAPLPDRTEDWTSITNVKAQSLVSYGGVFGSEKKIVQAQGTWWAHCEGPNNNTPVSLPQPFPANTIMQFRNRNTQASINGAPNLLIPPDSDVLFEVADGPTAEQYKDNCLDLNNPLKLRIVTPLYPQDFKYPSEYHGH